MIDDVKRFPEDFDEIGRELEDGDVLLGADGRTGKGVAINKSRVGGSGGGSGGGSSSSLISLKTGTEYVKINKTLVEL